MTRDTKPARDIKKDKHAYDKQQKKKHNDDDNEETSSSDNEDDGMNEHEYRKFLSKIFPSKYLDNKIKAGERLKSKLKPSLNVKKEESEEEEDEAVWETESEEENPTKNKSKQNSAKESNVNITFTIGGIGKDEDYYDEDYEDEDEDEDESASESEDEDESVSTADSSSQAESESESESELENELEDDAIYNRTRNKSAMRKNIEPQMGKNKKVTKIYTPVDNEDSMKNLTALQSSASSNDLVIKLKELLEQNKTNKMAQKCIDVCEDELAADKKKQAKKLAKTKAKNLRIFKKKVNDKNVMNDFSFYSKLDVLEQRAIIKELREVNKITQIEKPYRMTLL